MAYIKQSLHRLLRHFSNEAAVTKPVIQDLVRESHLPTHPPPLLNLSDTRNLFSSVPTSKLLRSLITLQLASTDGIVDIGIRAMNSADHPSWIRTLLLTIVKHTFFNHFCGGETSAEALDCLKKLNATGLRGMLDMAAEFAPDNKTCDQNFDLIMATISSSASAAASVSCVVVKMTAVYPLTLLQRISDLLRWQHKDSSFHLPWRNNHFPIFTPSSPLHHTLTKPPTLSQEEENELRLGWRRLAKLCEKSVEVTIPLVVDAEHSAVQPAIDYLTYSAAMEYNNGDKPIVYNTIQAYLRDAKEKVQLVTKSAEEMGFQIGVKLVRGAYMVRERRLAAELGYQSPIHNTINETHLCYNSCAEFLLEKISGGSGGVIIATHNVESGSIAAMKAKELGIGYGGNLEFAQLYGMADSLSFGLKNAGFRVSKYMPFGGVEKVIPYLVRRAEENRGVLSSSGHDRELMRKELKRRMKMLNPRGPIGTYRVSS